MVPGIKKPAYRVDRANWKLFIGNAAASLVLNGDGLPSVPFRVAITVTATTDHTDCAGTVTVGSETKTFTTSGQRMTTTTILSALPAITTSGQDCQILIEAISSSGANILKETLTSILVGFNLRQRLAPDSMGNFTIKEQLTKTTDTDCWAGGIIRIDGVDYTIYEANPKYKPGGREYMRKLTLRQ